jgi:hypothetical protein
VANEAAFTLKESYELETFGGSCAVGDKTLDVAERLEEGGGSIVTANEEEIRALDAYPALKRTAVSAAKEDQPEPESEPEGDGLDAMNKRQLLNEAQERGVAVERTASQEEIRAELRGHVQHEGEEAR